jgi:hypothetical protein
LIWPAKFEARLLAWNQLRDTCQGMPVDRALAEVNHWWFGCPWRPYYLHWDDLPTWPDPWDLLSDNTYCDLARALGITYTLMLLDHDREMTVEIADTDRGNLVLVDGGKYILNWSRDEVLNIVSTPISIKKRMASTKLKNKLG